MPSLLNRRLPSVTVDCKCVEFDKIPLLVDVIDALGIFVALVLTSLV